MYFGLENLHLEPIHLFLDGREISCMEVTFDTMLNNCFKTAGVVTIVSNGLYSHLWALP